MKIVVVGAGIAGLAAACRQAALGHDVVVLEQNKTVGGKISVVEKEGYTWDGGPSFFTDPGELERLFIDCGKKPEDYFAYDELDEACRYWFDGTWVKGYDSPRRLSAELESKLQEPSENTERYLRDVARIYEGSGSIFMDNQVTARTVLRIKNLKSALKLPKGSLRKSMHALHDSYFDRQETVQFFDRFATYVGADPYRAPGLLTATSYLEHVEGAFQLRGGMRIMIKAVQQLARDLDVDVKTNSKVTDYRRGSGVIDGVVCGAKVFEADAVINAADVANVYRILRPKTYDKHEAREHSLSGYVLYLGVQLRDPLYLHTILFSKDYKAETKALWAGEVYNDPTIYLNNTSYLTKTDAPKGAQNLFIMVNVPAGFAAERLPEVRKVVIEKLKVVFGADFEDRLITEADSLTPQVLESRFSAFRGSIYGLAANSIRGTYLRPKNKDEVYENLYHIGVTTHPGGGIPLALRSARIVSEMIG